LGSNGRNASVPTITIEGVGEETILKGKEGQNENVPGNYANGLNLILKNLTYKTALLIGAFQVLSLIPGTSRSGATIIGALLLGVSRYVAAEFTFFLAIPVMFGASAIKLLKFFLEGAGISGLEIALLGLGCIVAFVISVIAIKFLMGYIKKNDFKVFGWYRIVLGILVIGYFLIVR
jgi:undecaprenyl-diphosphatase